MYQTGENSYRNIRKNRQAQSKDSQHQPRTSSRDYSNKENSAHSVPNTSQQARKPGLDSMSTKQPNGIRKTPSNASVPTSQHSHTKPINKKDSYKNVVSYEILNPRPTIPNDNGNYYSGPTNEIDFIAELNGYKLENDKPIGFDTTEYANRLEAKLLQPDVDERKIELDNLKKYLAKVESKCTRLEIEHQTANDENIRLKDKLEMTQAMLNNQEIQLKGTEDMYNDIQIDYTNIESKNKKMEIENDNMRKQIIHLENENHDLNERANNFCELYNNEADSAQKMVEEKSEEVQRLQDQLVNLEATLEEYYSEHASQKSVLGDLMNRNHQLEEQAAILKEELEKRDTQRYEVKDRSTEYNAKIDLLEKKIGELQGLNVHYKDKLKSLEHQSAEYERMYMDIKSRFTDVEKSNKTMINSKKEVLAKVKSLEERYSKNSHELENLQSYNKRLEKYLLRKKIDLNEFFDQEEDLAKIKQ